MTALPVPTLVRLEYLTPDGWVVGHKGVNLMHPGRYVERLLARGKLGRATELDDSLQPTGQVWSAEVTPCSVCSTEHAPPDGSCLL